MNSSKNGKEIIIMNKIVLSLLFSTSVLFFVKAQTGYEAVLQQIEANSTTLSALRQQIEAQKLGNRTSIYMANPEVEFHYLWGNPDLVGNRTDISVRQPFDFPTAYGHRSKLANLQNTNAELLYKSERINLLLSARQICVELVYFNALAKVYAERLQNAERIAATFQSRLAKGDANALENNKAQLNLTTVQNEGALIRTHQEVLLSELKRMNGGIEVAFTDDNYPARVVPPNFEDWYASAESKSPMLQYVTGQIEISRQQVKLNQAMGLPNFSLGYMSERFTGEHFQGVMAGISVPLWENKNRVKQAKAQVKAGESLLNDAKIQFYNRLQNLHMTALSLQQTAVKYRKSITTNSNEPLLKKALDAGEISLLNYLMEETFYYDAVNKVLDAERDFELSIAELEAVEL
jgi:outer membrane protein TolC